MNRLPAILATLIALAWIVGVVWGVWRLGVDARVLQAFIAGGFVAGGWVFNGWQNRRREARLRQERLRDAHRAIYAEIGTNLSNLVSPESLRRRAEPILASMGRDPEYVPFLVRETNDRVFSEIVSEINVLPRVTIDPIVEYYTQITAIASLVEDMRSPAFAVLASERRQAIYRDLVEMRCQAFTFGATALALIEVFAAEGKAAAEAEAERFRE